MTMTYHMSMTKEFLLQTIQQYGVKALGDFDGTKESAIETIKADPRDTFVIGPCDNQSSTGDCLGHNFGDRP